MISFALPPNSLQQRTDLERRRQIPSPQDVTMSTADP